MSKVTLVSSDQVRYVVELEVAKCSGLIKEMLENLGYEEGSDEIIPLPNVDGYILNLVLEWAKHHKDDPAPDDDDDEEVKKRRSDPVSSWDSALMERERDAHFGIILAANYLDIKGLLEMACKWVATNKIQGKSVVEIRQTFGAVNDFEVGEEEQTREENRWAEEK